MSEDAMAGASPVKTLKLKLVARRY